MKLTFFNHYGNGDLFESREFVKDWMRLAGVTRADYAHRHIPNFFEDMPQITSVPMREDMDMRVAVAKVQGSRFKVQSAAGSQVLDGSTESRPTQTQDPRPQTPSAEDEEWLVNTWVGARNAETTPPGDYVLWPGVGCTVEHIYRMHNDYLREAGLPPLPRTLIEYLPTIDYSRVRIATQLHQFLARHTGERLVLVANGKTGSGHASNFDMGQMVKLLPATPGTRYLLTEPSGDPAVDWRPDVTMTDHLTGRTPPYTDLNAISYLSRFCAVVVGRCSGAQMHTQVLENWMDSTKTQVCFTQHRNGACFVLDPAALGVRMKVVWSPAATAEAAAAVLSDEV